MEVKLVAYGQMPDAATQDTIKAYLERTDRIKAHRVTFYSVDTAFNTERKARMAAEAERDALKARISELEAEE